MPKTLKVLFALVGILLSLIGLAYIAAIIKHYFVWLVVICLAIAAAYFWFKDKSTGS